MNIRAVQCVLMARTVLLQIMKNSQYDTANSFTKFACWVAIYIMSRTINVQRMINAVLELLLANT
jgi:hypothetical protein